MKYSLLLKTVLLFCLLYMVSISSVLKAQDNVGIGTNTPNSSAILELLSTNKGFLAPRLNTAGMNAIASPANSLLIYNTDSMCYYFYRQPSSTWISMCDVNSGSSVDSLFINYAGIDSLFAQYSQIDSLFANHATIDSLFASYINTDTLLANYALINFLVANQINVDSIFASYANIDSLISGYINTDSLFAYYANIDSLIASHIYADSLFANYGNIDSLFSHYIKTDSIYAQYGDFDSLLVNGLSIQSLVDSLINASDTDSICSAASTNYVPKFINPTAICNSMIYDNSVSVGVGTNVPDTSAILDISSVNKGILMPRIPLTNAADAVTIPNPATSLLVYNTGTGGLSPAGYYYNSGTTIAPVWTRFISSDACNKQIPTAQYPTFDGSSPYLLLGALWVGYDTLANCWKYNKQAAGRGLTDPGNPATWAINGSTINYFDGDLTELPSGTHINNRYNPKTMAARYSQDDIMVKTGSYWTDKYESRIINVSNGTWQDNDDNTMLSPGDTDIRGNGQGISPTWMSFSQKNQGSSGMSWFVAQQAALNSGKRLMTNAEWQGAAAGTVRSDATGMVANGDSWAVVADIDISRFGIVGMVGSLWEWIAEWGQYGPDSGVIGLSLKDQGAGYGNDGVQNVAGSVNTNNTSVSGGGSVAGIPGGVVRGGTWANTTSAGVFSMNANNAPSYWAAARGFRCSR